LNQPIPGKKDGQYQKQVALFHIQNKLNSVGTKYKKIPVGASRPFFKNACTKGPVIEWRIRSLTEIKVEDLTPQRPYNMQCAGKSLNFFKRSGK
jgi:hypothetical protein